MQNNTKKLLLLLVNLTTTLICIFLSTFVFMTIWNWFIPQITGFDSLTYISTFGIIVTINFVRKEKHTWKQDKTIEEIRNSIKKDLKTILMSGFYLLFGLILHSFLQGQI